jgi:methyl-accepting chemotaxis protein
MSHQAITKSENGAGTSIQQKLFLMLLLVAIVPMTILIVAIASGISNTIAFPAAIVAEIIGLVVSRSLASGIARQVTSINETLTRISQGDFEARAEKVTSDELGESARALNAVCDNTLNLLQSNDERDLIQNSIENLISEMKEIAAGDLTITTAISEDVTGSISASVNHMTQQLRSIVRQVQSAAEQVTTSSNRIRQASTTMSQDSDAQAKRIKQASEQLVEMTGSFQAVATMTQESVQVAVEARQTASNGLQAVADTVEGMQRIRNQVQSTSKRIKQLGESSQEIGEIVELISDITDRTSILALNASIQASMAGEAGQGFAVVAEEIERLAERSTDATKQISKLIRAIQNGTSQVISDMEESTREVVAGSQLADQAGATLCEIDSVSNQLVELIQSSSASALQQADTARRIAGTMSEISDSTRESAEKSREATRSVGLLADMVSQLRDSVSRFKVNAEAEQLAVKPASPVDPPATTESSHRSEPAALEKLLLEVSQQNRTPIKKKQPSSADNPQPASRPQSKVFKSLTETFEEPLQDRSSAKPEDHSNESSKSRSSMPLRTVVMNDDEPVTIVNLNRLDEESLDDRLLRQLRDANELLDNSIKAAESNEKDKQLDTGRKASPRTKILEM